MFEYKIPDDKAPGFLRRERKRLEFIALNEKARKDLGDIDLRIESQDAMLEWMVEYVTVPKKREDAREALMNASEEEITALQDAILTQGQIEKKASGSSGDGSEDDEKAHP